MIEPERQRLRLDQRLLDLGDEVAAADRPLDLPLATFQLRPEARDDWPRFRRMGLDDFSAFLRERDRGRVFLGLARLDVLRRRDPRFGVVGSRVRNSGVGMGMHRFR